MVKMARELGLKSLKVEELEFEFAVAAPARPPDAPRPKGRPVPTSEDFLLWSTGERLSFEEQVLTEAAKAAMPDAGPGKA